MRFDLGTLDSGERSLPFGLLVWKCFDWVEIYFPLLSFMIKYIFYLFQEKIKALQKHLAVNTTRLSSYIRAKTSAQDNRPLAVSIGALCVALLVTVFGSVILIDSSVLFKHSRMLVRKIKGFFALWIHKNDACTTADILIKDRVWRLSEYNYQNLTSVIIHYHDIHCLDTGWWLHKLSCK